MKTIVARLRAILTKSGSFKAWRSRKDLGGIMSAESRTKLRKFKVPGTKFIHEYQTRVWELIRSNIWKFPFIMN